MPLYLAAKLQIKIERTKKKGEKLASCSLDIVKILQLIIHHLVYSRNITNFAECIKTSLLKNGIEGLINIIKEDIYMEKIKNIWFDCGRLFMRSVDGNIYSRPLEAFPELLEASAEHRNEYRIDDDGEAINGGNRC